MHPADNPKWIYMEDCYPDTLCYPDTSLTSESLAYVKYEATPSRVALPPTPTVFFITPYIRPGKAHTPPLTIYDLLPKW